jgi:hypothetical protein
LTQPTHIVNGRPAIVQTLLKQHKLVIYTDVGYPRTEKLTQNQFARKARPIQQLTLEN